MKNWIKIENNYHVGNIQSDTIPSGGNWYEWQGDESFDALKDYEIVNGICKYTEAELRKLLSGRFKGANDNVFYEDEFVKFRWLNSKDQFQFYVKNTGFWYDASNRTWKGNSSSVFNSTGDVSNTGQQWMYFSDNGSHKSKLKLTNWGSQTRCTLNVEDESNKDKLPTYILEGGIGNTNFVWYTIKRID